MYSKQYICSVLGMVVTDPSKLDAAGTKILNICRQFGYWGCIIMATVEITKALMRGDSKDITKIIAKYLAGFGALYLLPFLFNLIKDVFE
jgi:hypothetical protein